jgi:3'-5' exonuclease
MDIKKLFFFDCEWVSVVNEYKDLNNLPTLKDSWDRLCIKWNKKREVESKPELLPSEFWDTKSFEYPEFNKIICISFGYINKEGEFKISSFYDSNEHEVLTLFNQLLNSVENKGLILAGHGIKRFDMPYLAKRMMVNGIKPSKLINQYGKKPWDVTVYDTVEAWGQGVSQESYTPLDWVCAVLGVPTSKDEISGPQIKSVFYTEGQKGLERIKTYCENDVKVNYEVAKIILSLS